MVALKPSVKEEGRGKRFWEIGEEILGSSLHHHGAFLALEDSLGDDLDVDLMEDRDS